MSTSSQPQHANGRVVRVSLDDELVSLLDELTERTDRPHQTRSEVRNTDVGTDLLEAAPPGLPNTA